MSWKERSVQFSINKKRPSFNRQESINEPLDNDTKTKHRLSKGISNEGLSLSFANSFDSQGYPSSTPRNGQSTKRARTTTGILSRFKKKTCCYYFQNVKKPGLCMCGRRKDDHTEGAIQVLDDSWDIKKHVRCSRTNAYGEVEFHGTNRKTRAKYVRVADDTNAQDALRFLLKEWKLEFPNFLVSVTGGAKTFKLPMKLKQLFSNGLYKVAQTTGAWVITGGTNTGVMKHVGEALQIASKGHYGSPGDSQKRVYCIGIATWGIVEHRNLLTQTKERAARYYMTNSIESQGACLDNNHTHFFLVDNGTIGRYGAEIKFRAQLEKQIMKMEVDKNRGNVPAILLVLEGGPNTIATVYEAITQDPAVPVIVIKDSGRAADLLAYAHNISHGEGSFFYMGDVVEHKQLFKRIEQTYPEMDQEGCLRAYGNILKCVEKKHMITIFKMEEGTADLDQAILTALLKSKSTSPEDQLKLALIWDRPDIARKQIFNEDLKWPLSSLESAMKDALENDRTEFVELLLEHGVNMSNFLTRDRLDSLYSVRARKRKSMLRYMLDKGKEGTLTLRDAENQFLYLTGLSLRSCASERPVSYVTDLALPLCNREDMNQTFQRPFNQLFVWAVLNNMQKMALCFWKHGEEAMAKALVACKLYFAMAKYADKRDFKDDIIETLKMNGEEFQTLAVELLDKCFVTDESRASKLMTYELKSWGNTTNLSLAVSSGHTLFVAHSCNQQLLTDIWGGLMTFRTQRSLKVVFCMFCPPLVLALGFRSNTDICKHQQMEGTLEQFENAEDEEAAEALEVEIDEVGNNDGKFKRNSTFGSSLQASQLSILSNSQKDVDTVMSGDIITAQSLKWWEKYLGFYTAPITKFWGNVLAYLVFLVLFTYVLLGKLPASPSRVEIVVIVFVISLTTEEIRQVLKSDNGRFVKKVYEWSRSKWNLCDGLAMFLFYVGLFLRLDSSTIDAARVVFAIDIMFWIIRLLDIFSVNQNLGPYVVIIGKMTIDLAYFLFIMAVFLLAYGVARQTILEPSKPASWESVAEIFFVPYFQVYGELFIDKEKLYAGSKTIHGTEKHNAYGEATVSLLMAFYLLVANILLLNLLIAIFNNTFAKVQVNSNQIWKFQRYHLILEYARRPPFVPPFVFLCHVISVLRWLYDRCRRLECCGGHEKKNADGTDRKIKIFPSAAELDDLMQFEEDCLADYLRMKDDIFVSTKKEKMRVMLQRVDNISWRIEDSKKENWTREERTDTKLFNLQHKLEELSKSVTEALSALNERNRSHSLPLAPANSLTSRQISMLNQERRSSEMIKKSFAKSAPKRFLSHNPYMHMPVYDDKSTVKEAAWSFRRSSLISNESPSKDQLMKAYAETDEICAGEDTVDAPPPLPIEQTQVDTIGQEQSLQRERSISCPHSFEDNSSGLENVREEGADMLEEHDTVDINDLNIFDSQFQISVQKKALTSPYPASGVTRFSIPDYCLFWTVDFPDYDPPEYTSPMLKLSNWVDKDTTSDIKFNIVDNGVNRVSIYGQYEIVNGRPRNPFGRTGITGRGLLGRWGPNHATEAVLTRWKRNQSGDKFAGGPPSLEFLALKRNEVTIPGEIIKSTSKIPEVILKALRSGNEKIREDDQIAAEFSDIFEISREFDDSRNTDNAWLETKVINYHDEAGTLTKNLKLENLNLKWIELDSELLLQTRHKECLAKIARQRGAHY